VSSTFLFILIYILGVVIGKFFKNNHYFNLMQIIIFILIFALSVWAGSEISDINTIINLLLTSIILSLIIIFITFVIGYIFLNFSNINNNLLKINININNFIYIILILSGWIIGLLLRVNISEIQFIITSLLCILALFAGLTVGGSLNINLLKSGLSLGIFSLVTSVLGSFISGFISYLLIKIQPITLSLGITLGSGWYTYTGLIIAEYYGPYFGTLGFLVNFWREQLTFIMMPILAKLRPNPISMIAIGGATSMDTTLGLYTLLLGSEYSMSAVFSGAILTFIIPIILPIILSAG
jgi:uncharacterized membrane protein YbjE (DUF340 family)